MALDFGRIVNTSNRNKLLYQGKTSEGRTKVILEKDAITIADAKSINGLTVTNDFGSGFVGPVSFASDIGEIRMSMLWHLNRAMLTALPSTIYTPIPVLKESVPTFGITEMSASVGLAIAGLAVAATAGAS